MSKKSRAADVALTALPIGPNTMRRGALWSARWRGNR
jgi:hypothetical protein